MKINPRIQTLPYKKKGDDVPQQSCNILNVLVTMNQERFEVTLAIVRVHVLDLTGSISVAMTPVKEPRPTLYATVKIISRGNGAQLHSGDPLLSSSPSLSGDEDEL